MSDEPTRENLAARIRAVCRHCRVVPESFCGAHEGIGTDSVIDDDKMIFFQCLDCGQKFSDMTEKLAPRFRRIAEARGLLPPEIPE